MLMVQRYAGEKRVRCFFFFNRFYWDGQLDEDQPASEKIVKRIFEILCTIRQYTGMSMVLIVNGL